MARSSRNSQAAAGEALFADEAASDRSGATTPAKKSRSRGKGSRESSSGSNSVDTMPAMNGSAVKGRKSNGTSKRSVSSTTPGVGSAIVDGEEATRLANQADENVFLFVPNLIGYARIILAALSLYFMKEQPKTCTLLYGVSCLLDAADGVAARRLGQATKFGAVLDMVTDRCTTACLLCFLTTAYPRCAIIFQGLITLDFSSHYIHMYSSLLTGAQSHKLVTSDVSWILWYYYNDSRTLFFYCAGNELFFVCLYLMDFYPTPLGIKPEWLLWFLGRGTAASLIQSAKSNPQSVQALVFEMIRRLTWPQVVGALTFPICFVKQVINAVQFWKAAKVLVGIDLAERAQKRKGASKRS